MGSREEFRQLVALIEEKKMKTVVDSVHSFNKVEDAFTLMKEGKNFGKIVIQVHSGAMSANL